MLPNRIYTSEELRALTVAAPVAKIPVRRESTPLRPATPVARLGLFALVGRAFGRHGVRRSAPGTI